MTDARILSLIETFAPSSRLVRSWPLTGGISAQMTAFEAQSSEGELRRFIVRQPSRYRFARFPGVAATEFQTLTLLREAGLPVPPPVLLDEGADPVFVVEYLEGKPELAPMDVSRYLDRYAEMLARVHRVDWTRIDLSFLPLQGRGYGSRPEAPNESLRESEIRDVLKTNSIKGGNSPVLCHADFWPGNLIWRDGEIAGVIDWEEAEIGEPLADLAICRLDLFWVLGMEAMEAFTERYQDRMSLDLTDLPYWDLCASLRPIQNLHEWAPSYPNLERPDVTEATMRRDHQAFVEQALHALSGD
ncbi:hypothetical protein BH11ARM2_BH11ARM2_28090 [soil metagenome]